MEWKHEEDSDDDDEGEEGEEDKVEFVYILKLAEGKYYVGHSWKKNVWSRVKIHIFKLDTAAEWTKKYNVLSVIQVVWGGSLEDERCLTLQLMKEHGWENVRGSVYCEVNMKEPPVDLLTPTAPQYRLKLLQANSQILQNCLECNQPGHYARDCPNVHCRLCGKHGHVAKNCRDRAFLTCYQCGEIGHMKRDCTVKEARCLNCKQPGHFVQACPEKTSTLHLTKTYGPCRKCGKNGHWQANCHASSSSTSMTTTRT